MKTIKSYYDKSIDITKPFAAKVVDIKKGETPPSTLIILDKTIFYPEGGGQQCDTGTIKGIPVIDVQEKDGLIYHTTNADTSALKVGDNAECLIDVQQRREYTVLHSGEHLLAGMMLKTLGCQTVSIHLGRELCTADFKVPNISEEELVLVGDAVQSAIEEDHPIITHECNYEQAQAFTNLRKALPKDEDEIRIVEIQGCDIVACCGTHVSSTAKIGILQILGAEKYKGMTRVTFIAGRRVLNHSRILYSNAAACSHILNVPPLNIAAGLKEYSQRYAAAEYKLKQFIIENAKKLAQRLIEDANIAGVNGKNKFFIHVFETETMEEVQIFNKEAQKLSDSAIVSACLKELKVQVLCNDKSFDLRQILTPLKEKYNASGGGGPSSFQASFISGETLKAFLDAIPYKSA